MDESDSFIQEVDEQVATDRVLTAAKRYAPWIGGAFALVLLGVVGWETSQNMQRDSARKQSDTFAAAQEKMRGSDAAAAATAFQALETSGPDIYRVMAMMQRAGALEGQGDMQGALAEFDHAAQVAKDPIVRDSARLRAAYIVADTQDYQAVQTRVQPLIDAHTQISYLARELLAVKAWEAGHADVARSNLQAISLAIDAPDSLRQRVQLELTVIGPAAASATPAPAAHANTTPPAGEPK